MVEAGEDLPLLHEAPADPLRVDSLAQQLQRDALLELAVAPLGDPDLAHAPAPEKRDENVRPDRLARRAVGLVARIPRKRGQPRRVLGGAGLEEGAGRAVGGEQLAHEAGERGIGRLERHQPGAHRFRTELHQLAENHGGFAEARVRCAAHGWAAGPERVR
jgi:hypothetical protein